LGVLGLAFPNIHEKIIIHGGVQGGITKERGGLLSTH